MADPNALAPQGNPGLPPRMGIGGGMGAAAGAQPMTNTPPDRGLDPSMRSTGEMGRTEPGYQNEEMVDEELNAKYGEEATPQEQESYDNAVVHAQTFIHGERNATLLQMIENPEQNADPAQFISEQSVNIVEATDAEIDIPDELMIPVAMEVVEFVGELVHAKSKSMRVNQGVIQQAAEGAAMDLTQRYGNGAEDIQQFVGNVEEPDAQRAVDVAARHNNG